MRNYTRGTYTERTTGREYRVVSNESASHKTGYQTYKLYRRIYAEPVDRKGYGVNMEEETFLRQYVK